MRYISLLALILCFTASFAIAQDSPQDLTLAPAEPVASAPAEVEVLILKGDIIDNMCAGAQKPEALVEFVKMHTKECATTPACKESGYSLVVDGMLNKLDKDSQVKVTEFLGAEGNKLAVVVEAKKAGEELSIISIKNQE